MRKRYALIAAGLGFASLLSACSDTSPGKKADNEVACVNGSFYDADFSPIVGGQLVADESWVARKTVFLLATGDDEAEACTATLIDRDVILTAAHCVESVVKEPSKLKAIFSSRPQCDVENKTILSKAVSASAIRMHDSYDGGASAVGGGDIALVKLETGAPATAETVEIRGSAAPWVSYDRVLLAGYGKTVGGTAEDPRPVSLRALVRKPLTGESMAKVKGIVRASHLSSMSDAFAEMWLDLIFDSSAESEAIWLDQTDRRGACSGDSGGPAFVIENGKVKQLGIATSVLTSSDPEDTCLIASNYTNVLKYKEWISENYKALTGRDPSRIFPE